MGDKGSIVVVNRGRGIEQYRFQILPDIADLRCILFQTVHDKLNMQTVELHKLCLYQLCRVVVPGNTDRLSCAAYRFKDQINDFVDTLFLIAVILNEDVILDIVLDDFLINPVCVVLFLSVPFLRLCRCFVPA